MQKDSVRQEMRLKREKLKEKQVEEASLAVYNRLIEMEELKKAKAVLVYADFSNEIQTGRLVGWLLFQKKKVGLPLVEDGEMSALDYRGTLLKLSGFGIAQPMGHETVLDPKIFDVVICPGVAFSKNLDRLGFGQGYYDRFLKEATKACKIGLAYDFQIVDSFDTEEHDVRMNYVVTPSGVIS